MIPVNPASEYELPYRDTKPQGSADFYFAINATFRYILVRFGREGWVHYLNELGRGYYSSMNDRWRKGGMPVLARYWKAFFAAEPGAVVEVKEFSNRVEIRVLECPAIKHLRAGRREIVKEFCQHCHILGQARAEAAGFTMRLKGGNGSCLHIFASLATNLPPQDPVQIAEAHL